MLFVLLILVVKNFSWQANLDVVRRIAAADLIRDGTKQRFCPVKTDHSLLTFFTHDDVVYSNNSRHSVSRSANVFNVFESASMFFLH